MKVRIIFKAADSWIGAFEDTDFKPGISVLYVFLIPMIGFRFEWKSKESTSNWLMHEKLWAWYWNNFGLLTIFLSIIWAWIWVINLLTQLFFQDMYLSLNGLKMT